MTEPYRSTTNTCPSCAAPLREFAKRLVCDECEGMLIGIADFGAACTEVTGEDHPLTYREDAATQTSCPRCGNALTACKLTVGTKKIKAAFLRCERDGLWCGPGVLAGVFAVLGRSSVLGTSGAPRDTGGGGAARLGLDGLPVRSHRPASAALAISAWRDKPRKRPQTAMPVDPYREHDLACPACPAADRRELHFAGDRWTCDGCHGAFAEKGAVEALIEEMSNQPYELAPPSGSPGPRGCPVCAEAMVVEKLASMEIDRCEKHGLWFDQHELQTALVEIGTPPSTGIVGWLHRLFG